MKPKTTPKPSPSPRPETPVPNKGFSTGDGSFSPNDPMNKIFEHFWVAMMEKQQVIGQQLEENDRLFQKQLEERRLQMEESDKKFHMQLEERNRQLNESDKKFYTQIEESRRKFYLERKDYGYSFDEDEEDFDEGSKKRGKKKTKGLLKKKGRALFGGSKLTEQAVSSGIIKQFKDLSFYYDDVSHGRKILDSRENTRAEYDLILESPEGILAVEEVSKPAKKDIDVFINKLFILRAHRDRYQDRRKIHGALACEKIDNTAKQAAFDAGLFLIEKGKLVPPDGGMAREW